MRRKIPSTAALTAFEAAARHQSFTKAADELALTQSAVCRQVAALETYLGVKLFRRTRRGVTLTEAGGSYGRSVSARLDDVERDTLDMMARGTAHRALEIGVVPTFGTRWLIPRLRDFAERQPGITIHLAVQTRPFLFADTALDAAIYAGPSGWPGTESHFLMREHLLAVASPRHALPQRALRAREIARLPLLQMSTRPYAWRQWFQAAGVDVPGDMAGPRFELFSMLAEAAIQGLGVALVPSFLVADELAAGKLVDLARREQLSDRSYYLIHPEHLAEDASLAAFRTWLQGQAEAHEGR